MRSDESHLHNLFRWYSDLFKDVKGILKLRDADFETISQIQVICKII